MPGTSAAAGQPTTQVLELSKGNRPAAVTATGHETIDADANEFFLFHGTAPDTARVIAKNGTV